MKKILLAFSSLIAIVLVFTGCAKKDDYLGKWFALTADGRQVIIEIDDKNFVFYDENTPTEKEEYTFKQTGSGFENSASYAWLQTDTRKITLVFPNKKDLTKAIILSPKSNDDPLIGNLLYTLEREEYPQENYRLI